MTRKDYIIIAKAFIRSANVTTNGAIAETVYNFILDEVIAGLRGDSSAFNESKFRGYISNNIAMLKGG